MKSNYILITIILLSLVTLNGSCSKESNNDSPIVGTWVSLEGKDYPYINIKSNGQYEYKMGPNGDEQFMSGKYTFNNDILSLGWRFPWTYKVTFDSPDVINLYGGGMPDHPQEFKLKRK